MVDEFIETYLRFERTSISSEVQPFFGSDAVTRRGLPNYRDLRRAQHSGAPLLSNRGPQVPNQLASSYEIAYLTEKIVSIRHTFFHYGRGAAHPNHGTTVTNVQLGPLLPLRLTDLFFPKIGLLDAISEFCISQLTEAKDASESSESFRRDWIHRDTDPDLKNFSEFNIADAGLFITFDEYDVACYAEGPSHVLVARNLLTEFLNPKCALVELWRSFSS